MRATAPTANADQVAPCFSRCGWSANLSKCLRETLSWPYPSQTMDVNEGTRFVPRARFDSGRNQSIDQATPSCGPVPFSEPKTSPPSPTSLFAVRCRGLSFQKALHATTQRPMILPSLFAFGERQEERGRRTAIPSSPGIVDLSGQVLDSVKDCRAVRASVLRHLLRESRRKRTGGTSRVTHTDLHRALFRQSDRFVVRVVPLPTVGTARKPHPRRSCDAFAAG